MKTKTRTATRIGTAVLALALVGVSHAQLKEPPKPGTYYSAKDFEWSPPWPFNPHPELQAVEIAPGIFVFDDIGLPDTPEQVAARAAHQAAVEHAKALAANPALAEAERAARQEAQARAWEANRLKFAASLHAAIADSRQSPVSYDTWLESRNEALATRIPDLEARDRANAERVAKVSENPDSQPVHILQGGRKAVLDSFEGDIPLYFAPQTYNAARTISTDRVWPGGVAGLNLLGSNTVVGIWDGGATRTTHQEFTPSGRIVQRDGSTTLDWHATAVAGVLSARGLDLGSPYGRLVPGMAQAATVWTHDQFSRLTEIPTEITNSLRLSNHSYGPAGGWEFDDQVQMWRWYGWTPYSQNEDWKFGIYLSESADMDTFAYTHPEYLAVFAAGNDRTNVPPTQPIAHLVVNPSTGLWVTNTTTVRNPDGDQGGYDTMNGWGGAKNVLTVGAVNDLVGGYTNAAGVTLASFSSFGPMDDGRLKPDVVANGVNVVTTADGSDASYFYPNGPNGTSFSAPSVTGSIDLLAERYGQLHPNARRLQAASFKGLVIHTADECGPALGPDYAFGWGLMNTRTATDLLGLNATNGWKAYIKEVLLQSSNYIEFPVVVSGSTNTLKVTICWSDPPGTPPATGIDPTNRMLINDLDLRVFGPSGSTNFPWVLNPDLVNKTSAARGAAATKGDNVLDNVEQVMITNAAAGTYTVRVTHKGTLQNNNPQWVSILTTGQTPQAKPPLVITDIAVTASNLITLQWSAVVGQRYQVQYRDNVEGPGWTNFDGEVSAMRTNVSLNLPFSPSQPQRFYQVAEVE